MVHYIVSQKSFLTIFWGVEHVFRITITSALSFYNIIWQLINFGLFQQSQNKTYFEFAKFCTWALQMQNSTMLIKIINLGNDTLGNPIFQKILSTKLAITSCIA